MNCKVDADIDDDDPTDVDADIHVVDANRTE